MIRIGFCEFPATFLPFLILGMEIMGSSAKCMKRGLVLGSRCLKFSN